MVQNTHEYNIVYLYEICYANKHYIVKVYCGTATGEIFAYRKFSINKDVEILSIPKEQRKKCDIIVIVDILILDTR